MRILYNHRVQSRDGMSIHIEEFVSSLRAIGHEVLVVGPSFYAKSSFGGESRTVVLARKLLPGAIAELFELAYNCDAYYRLRRACNSFRPDMIYVRSNLYFFAASILVRRRQLLFYLEVNSPLASDRGHETGLRFRRLAAFLERYVWASADRVFVVSEVLKGIVVTAGVSPERIIVTPNGSRLQPCHRRRRSTDPTKPIILGFVGFVRAWHGLDTVIRAMATDTELAHTILVIAGNGPARSDLEVLAKQLGIGERVRFAGNVEHARVGEWLAQFDIALQPRALPYASPLKIFDYMAGGCAIVAPDQPNIREILAHECTALLFSPHSAEGLAASLRRLVADATLRVRLGDAAKAELIRKDYTWIANARRVTSSAMSDIAATAYRRRLARP